MSRESDSPRLSLEHTAGLAGQFSPVETRGPAAAPPRTARMKFALAGVLVVVFVFVMLPRKETTSGCSLSQELPRPATPTLNAAPQEPPAVKSAPPAGPTPHKAMPPIELSTIVSRNPFAGSNRSATATPLTADRDTAPAAVSQNDQQETFRKPNLPPPPTMQVSAIITGKGRPAALVDNRLLFENDIVQEQWRVVAIRPTGLLLEPLQSASTP